MPTSESAFEAGAVVRVPFPYSDAQTRQRRPALVVATAGSDTATFLIWVLMITSSAHRRWDGDVEIPDAGAAGLPIPSLVRTAKIASIDIGQVEPRGGVAPDTLLAVRVELRRRLHI